MLRRHVITGARQVRRRLRFLGGTLVAACQALPAPDRWAPPAFDEAGFARAVDRLRRDYGQVALAAAVVRSEGPVRRAVAGTLVAGESMPALPTHRFHAGSTTKGFTALLAAQVVQEGRLAWTTTLAEALPTSRCATNTGR